MSAVLTLGVMVEVCILLSVEAKRLLKFIRLCLKLELFFSAQSIRLSIMLTRRKNYQREIPAEKSNVLDFQRDVDISTFASLDQAQPFHSLTFHLKSWPQESNDGRLLNI